MGWSVLAIKRGGRMPARWEETVCLECLQHVKSSLGQRAGVTGFAFLRLECEMHALDERNCLRSLSLLKGWDTTSGKFTLSKLQFGREVSGLMCVCGMSWLSLLCRAIREAPCRVSTTRSGTWWASRAGGKVVLRGNGLAFTPMCSSMWTGS